MAAIHDHANSELLISWETLSQETQKDQELQLVLTCIRNGTLNDEQHKTSMKNFWRYRNALYELDGVVLYDDRVVVPSNLRARVLDTLHAAHQGVSSMEVRARSIVFWPGMTLDMDRIRANCKDCKCMGQFYLIFADRLSGWVDIFKAPPGSPQAGAEGLMCCLRNVFSRFGVPEELSSDGGKEFTADATKAFYARWGIHHRDSASYNPQSNGRAEVAVKTAKRLLQSNTAPMEP